MYQKSAAPTAINRANGAGWKARHDLANAKIAAQRDPRTVLIRRIRSLSQSLQSVTQIAREDYAAMHIPVASGVPALVHPEIKAKLDAFMRETGLEGHDLTRPLTDDLHRLDEMIAERQEAVRADHREALESLARLERENAEREMAAVQVKLAKLNDTYGLTGDETAIDSPKRGPGRPRKDASSDITASETH